MSNSNNPLQNFKDMQVTEVHTEQSLAKQKLRDTISTSLERQPDSGMEMYNFIIISKILQFACSKSLPQHSTLIQI